MTRKLGAAAGAALIAVLVLLLNVLPAQAPPPIATEFLTDRAVFTDDVQLTEDQAGRTQDPGRDVGDLAHGGGKVHRAARRPVPLALPCRPGGGQRRLG